ncbi:MAG: hypothetical protein D6694_11595 [Gammaproteobacteria bacterium]|nr:MAG: hypothetical protein D6694_11595 [Gammaproteobacteria bacterium]
MDSMYAMNKLHTNEMKLPDFLVIGAMKSGTTSLCRDLANHPKIYFPPVKEPHTLCLEDVVTPNGRRKYADLFRGASPHQICGEGSTGYTKLPYSKKVPFHAKEVCGSDLRLIYIVRDPLERALSHHYHAYRAGQVSADFSVAIEQDKTILTCSKYAFQLRPWIDVFGLDKICVIRFEDYVVDRKKTIDSVCRFLGLEPIPSLNNKIIMNAGERQSQAPKWLRESFFYKMWSRFKRGQFYKRSVRPFLDDKWINGLKQIIFTDPPPPRPPLPSPEVVEAFVRDLREDQEQFRILLNLDKPMWDLEVTQSKYVNAKMGRNV